jgi:LCP family protein required for cell wall assembly
MKNRKQKRKRLIRRVILLVVLLLVVGVGYTGAKIWNGIGQSYHPVERLDPEKNVAHNDSASHDKKELNKPISILLMGVDERSYDIGRTDTLIVAVLNPHTKQATLVSIPRDTYVEIAGKNYSTKINGAYQYGIATVIATVENFLHIPIDYYAEVNFQGFEDAIDALGGINVDVEKDMYYVDKAGGLNINLKKGPQLLTGEEALGYARFRHDAEGDFGRMRRQQQVIAAAADELLKLQNLNKALELVDIAGKNLRTDLTTADMAKIFFTYRDFSTSQIESVELEGVSDRFGKENLWYYLVDEEERNRVGDLLNEQLELKQAM